MAFKATVDGENRVLIPAKSALRSISRRSDKAQVVRSIDAEPIVKPSTVPLIRLLTSAEDHPCEHEIDVRLDQGKE